MKKIFKYAAVLFFVVSAAACNITNPIPEGTVLARVGEKKLYISDLASGFTPGITPEDSLKLLGSYVDIWVKQQLKVEEAERLFLGSGSEIEKMVETYRNSLLSRKLEQYFVDRNIDTLITDEQASKYYELHRSDFVLDRIIVKGTVLKLPSDHRQKKKMMELMNGTGERYQDFKDLCQKNNFDLAEFDTWTEFSEFISCLPPAGKGGYDALTGSRSIQEIKSGADSYLVYISSCLKAGDMNPLERVRDAIDGALYNQRKREIIRNYEDSIYKAALYRNTVEIKIK